MKEKKRPARRFGIDQLGHVLRPRRGPGAARRRRAAPDRLGLSGDAVRGRRVLRQERAAPREEDRGGLLPGHQQRPAGRQGGRAGRGAGRVPRGCGRARGWQGGEADKAAARESRSRGCPRGVRGVRAHELVPKRPVRHPGPVPLLVPRQQQPRQQVLPPQRVRPGRLGGVRARRAVHRAPAPLGRAPLARARACPVHRAPARLSGRQVVGTRARLLPLGRVHPPLLQLPPPLRDEPVHDPVELRHGGEEPSVVRRRQPGARGVCGGRRAGRRGG